ncbi:hypothetical protein H0H87_001372 [Tephrocybe sp. NHM501043]|nr:hypothetical protein H0H87_001372 [Tephrocybe sp. NHM501043]
MSTQLRAARVTLANLRPAPGSQHKVSPLMRAQNPSFNHSLYSKNVLEEGKAQVMEEPLDETYAPVNLDRIQHWIDQGRLTSSPESPITARELLLSGCVHDVHDGIKILGDGAQHFKTPIYIKTSRASKSAIKAIESNGGKVVCQFYNPLALRDCVKGRTDRTAAAPTRREDIALSKQLGAWKHQEFDVQKKK